MKIFLHKSRSRRRTKVFKKLFTSAIMTSVAALTIPFMTATTVEAHPGCKYHRSTSRASARRTTYRRTNTTYASYPSQAYANGYSDSYGNEYVTTRTTSTVVKRPGFYSRHRRLVNTGIGAAAGAIIGGLIGGKRGALARVCRRRRQPAYRSNVRVTGHKIGKRQRRQYRNVVD